LDLQSYHTRVKAKASKQYISQTELNEKAKQVLPDPPPSAAHQNAVTKAIKTFLSTPLAPPCCICDAHARPGQEHDTIDPLDLPASSEYVLQPPDGLHHLLREEYDVSKLFHTKEATVLMSKLMLSPRGVRVSTLKSQEPLLVACKKCMTSLEYTTRVLRKLKVGEDGSLSDDDKKKLYPPQLAIANGNFPGRWPKHIRDMKPRKSETALISRHYNSSVLERVYGREEQKGGPGQYKLFSHVTTYELNIKEVITSLPLAPSSCPYRVLISGPRGAKLRELTHDRYKIRRAVVRAMLVFLVEANPLYKDITIDEDVLARLPEDAIDEGMVTEDYGSPETSVRPLNIVFRLSNHLVTVLCILNQLVILCM
jgi:hypothetical protein